MMFNIIFFFVINNINKDIIGNKLTIINIIIINIIIENISINFA